MVAWDAAGPEGKMLSGLFSDPGFAPRDLVEPLEAFIRRHCTADFATPISEAILGMACNSVFIQAFWQRQGVLYEPTAALYQLLEASDVVSDIPLGMLRLPAPALCMVPAPSMRDGPDGLAAVLAFEHGGPGSDEDDPRWLTFVMFQDDREHDQTHFDILRICVEDDSESIVQKMESLLEFSDVSGPREQRWRRTLDYVVKMLLYLSLDGSPVIHDRAYSLAPRNFAGLGKRKRMERQAAIDRLYDRYIIGPAVLAEAHGHVGGGGTRTHEARAHWRREHFRMQPFGRALAQRKLIFVMPTLVRADQPGVVRSPSGQVKQDAPHARQRRGDRAV